jgi:hypothetical protein
MRVVIAVGRNKKVPFAGGLWTMLKCKLRLPRWLGWPSKTANV